MKDDLSRSYRFWIDDDKVVFTLGCDNIGKGYFLHLEGLEALLEKQIGFRVEISFDPQSDLMFPADVLVIIQNHIMDEQLIDELLPFKDNGFVNIIAGKEDSSPVLKLGMYAVTGLSQDKLDSSNSILSLYIDCETLGLSPTLTKKSVKKFLNGITWHK